MNMNRRIKTITVKTISAVAVTTISAMAMALSSCTNEVAEDESADENGVALSIVSATIEETDTRVESLDAETFEENDTIGLYIFNEAGDAYNEANDNYNVPAEYDGTEWDVLGSIYISDESAKVMAYYPRDIDYGETIGTGSSGIPFDILEQDDILYTDVMSVDNSNPEVEFVFHHLLSRITFSISVSDDIGSINISKAGIKSADSDMESDIYISPSTEGWSTYVESYTDEIYCFANELVTSEESAEVDVLVYPCSTSNKSAVLVIDGASYSIDLPELTDEWEQGCQYIYYVTSVEGNIVVSYETYIDAWDSGETTGNVDIITNTENEPEAVDLGLTVKWATFNVGASSPEEFGNYFAWGETEPKDKYSLSTYFDSDYEISEDIAGTEYDVATVKWGESWRMPTSEEISELMKNCTFERCTQDEVIGELVTGTNGNTIFLPATGRYTGSVLTFEHNCYYWSSTPADGEYAYSLHIVRSDGKFEMCDERSRFRGLPVRPVLVE